MNRNIQIGFDGQDREILRLCDIEEMSGPETAALLGLTLAAMRS